MVKQSDKERLQVINDHVNKRTSEPIETSICGLKEISMNIKQLNSYIDGNLELSNKKIYNILTNLYSNFSLNLIYELNENIVLRRARKFEEKKASINYCFTCLKDLLSVPDEKKHIIKTGRLNKAEKSVYYASISDKNFNSYDVALSEVDAMETDYINILDSITTKSLNAVYIGAFNFVLKGWNLPEWIHPYYKEVYKLFQDKCLENNNKYLFESYILCSTFFSDILRRKGHDKLYDITSMLASIIFEKNNIDAIVYESVQIEGAPVIAIKPNAVKEKVKHQDIFSFRVDTNLGYGLYYGEEVNNGNVENGQLKWTTA